MTATWLQILPILIVLVTVTAVCLYFDRNRANRDDENDEE